MRLLLFWLAIFFSLGLWGSSCLAMVQNQNTVTVSAVVLEELSYHKKDDHLVVITNCPDGAQLQLAGVTYSGQVINLDMSQQNSKSFFLVARY